MASVAVATRFSPKSLSCSPHESANGTGANVKSFLSLRGITRNFNCIDQQSLLCKRLPIHHINVRHLNWHLSATRPGSEATITDSKKYDLSLGDVKIVVESRDDDTIDVRVDLTGEETQKVFDDVLTNMARTAPPIPGFRRSKGGKTSNVPKSFLLQMLGRDRVAKFVIQEILSLTLGDYAKKENLTVKSEFTTIQSSEELEAAFLPGSAFSFNAKLEIEAPELTVDEQDLEKQS